MRRRLIVRTEAEADIAEATLWYDERERGLGVELLLEIRAAIERASENPLHYLVLRRKPEVRRVLARRFPYRIFFIVRNDAIMAIFSLVLISHAPKIIRRLVSFINDQHQFQLLHVAP